MKTKFKIFLLVLFTIALKANSQSESKIVHVGVYDKITKEYKTRAEIFYVNDSNKPPNSIKPAIKNEINNKGINIIKHFTSNTIIVLKEYFKNSLISTLMLVFL